MKTFEEVLKIAKTEYISSIRGKEYQEALMSEIYDDANHIDYLQRRKDIYVQNIALLEAIFGTELLQNIS